MPDYLKEEIEKVRKELRKVERMLGKLSVQIPEEKLVQLELEFKEKRNEF